MRLHATDLVTGHPFGKDCMLEVVDMVHGPIKEAVRATEDDATRTVLKDGVNATCRVGCWRWRTTSCSIHRRSVASHVSGANAAPRRDRRTAARSLLAALLASACAASAAEQPAASDVAQANNPLANFTAFNLHNYYIGEFTDANGRSGDQFLMRYARPFSLGQTNWLMRATLPINSFPAGPGFERQTGVGDFSVIAPYLIDTGDPALSVGIGPQLTAPTATKDALGSGKWSAGLVHVLFDAGSPKFQWGYLLSWQHSFAGDDGRATVNQAALQPFGFWQLGGGTYLRSTGVMVWNLNRHTYSVPVGLGIGQVIPTQSVVFNLFVEPQVSVADKGALWPVWQVFVGLNMQFKD
jgi:hypothetical protein